MFGAKIDTKPIVRRGNGRVMTISISALAAAVPALWLGGCLATRRPAWFLSRQTVRKIRGTVEDVKDKMEDLKETMEDVRDRVGALGHRVKRNHAKGWLSSILP